MALNMFSIVLILNALLNEATAQPVTVNNIKYTDNGCAIGSFGIETGSLNPKRGDPDAPCTGYVNYETVFGSLQRVCGRAAGPFGQSNGQPGALFHPTVAKRICYGLGVNMHKGDTEDIMLYSCDAYFEEDAGVAPLGAAVTSIRATYDYNVFSGERCLASSDENCFEDCYSLDVQPSDFGSNCAFFPFPGPVRPVPALPYWAITCGDIDECANGVMGHCQGGLEMSCTQRKACGHNTTCTNMPGSWQCDCMDGYEIADTAWLYDETRGCQDIDECADDTICGTNGECRNTDGSYFCLCVAGYLYNEETRKCDDAPCGPNPELLYAEAEYNYMTAAYDTTVSYECEDGYRVSSDAVYDISTSKFGYSSETEFELTCSAKGEWEPKPHPRCVAMYCGDPGTVANSVRSGEDFHYGSIVIFSCHDGFEVDYEGYLYKDDEQNTYYFYYTQAKDHYGIKCLDEEKWSHKFKCKDIDECKTTQPCKPNQQCINTVGSYLCICESGHRLDTEDDDSGNNCVEYDNFPSSCEIMERLKFCENGDCVVVDGRADCKCKEGFTGPACDQKINDPCEIMNSMDLCVNGICEVYQEKANCQCDYGFEGKTCEVRTYSLALILAIVALVLAGTLVLILLVRIIARSSLFGPPTAPAARPAAAPPVVPSDVYGGFSRLSRLRPFQGPIIRRPRQMPL